MKNGPSICDAYQGTSAPCVRSLTRRRTCAKISSRVKPAGRDHFRERGRISAIGTLLVGSDRARRRIESDRHVAGRIDQREAARQRLPAARERILPRRIENDDLHAARKRRERLGEIGDPDRLQRHVDVALDVGVDRDEIILALELHAIAGEIDQRDRVRSRGGNLAEKFAKGFPQRGLIEVARAGDRESGGLQRVGDESGIVGGCCKLAGLYSSLPITSAKRISAALADALTERRCEDNDEHTGTMHVRICPSRSPIQRSFRMILSNRIIPINGSE